MAHQFVKWTSNRGTSNEGLRHTPAVINNANGKRYFSSVDAEIYFGDQFIDEVVNITWSIQQNAMPLFGYNSYTFDDLAIGNRIVQGSFVVNFTQSNYLGTVLNAMTKISRATYGSDYPNESVETSAEMRRRRLPKWDAGFNIVIGYGEKNSGDEYEQVVILDCCQITGCQQQLDYNGEPLLEAYSFIARDIKVSNVGSSDSSTSTDTDINNNSSSSAVIADDLNIGTGKVILNDSNNSIEITYTPKDNLTASYILLDSIDNKVFNIAKELSRTSTDMKTLLSQEEKKAIIRYCSENKMNKIDAVVKYSLNYDGQTTSKECRIVLDVIL